MAWEPSKPGSSFALGHQLGLPTSLLNFHWTTQLPGVLASPSGKIGLEDTLHRGWGYNSAPCLSVGKPGSRASKDPTLRIWNQVDLHPAEFLGLSASPSCFCRWAKTLVGITTWALQVWTGVAKILVLAVVNPFSLHHSQIPSGWDPQTPLQSLWYEIRVGLPQTGCPQGSFPSGGKEAHRGLSMWCWAGLGEGTVVSLQPLPASNAACLISEVQVVPQPHLCSRMLSVLSCSWIVVCFS